MTDVLDRVEGKLVYAADVLDLFYVASAGQDKAFIAVVEDVVESVPAIDAAEVIYAEWIINSDGYYPYCSNCKNEPDYGIMSYYCPMCGAKMSGGAE